MRAVAGKSEGNVRVCRPACGMPVETSMVVERFLGLQRKSYARDAVFSVSFGHPWMCLYCSRNVVNVVATFG